MAARKPKTVRKLTREQKVQLRHQECMKTNPELAIKRENSRKRWAAMSPEERLAVHNRHMDLDYERRMQLAFSPTPSLLALSASVAEIA